jgi:hypothetical protein
VPVAIAGMHRSGTSMTARLLNLVGVHLGASDELLEATADNPAGYWENKQFVDVNDTVLAALGAGWDCPPPADAVRSSLPALVDERQVAEELVERFRPHEPWGWKDPRNSLTLPFWRRIVPGLRVVVCVRHPSEVAESLRRRGMFTRPLSLHLWSVYNKQALADAPDDACLVTHYKRFFADPEAELHRLLDFCGVAADPEKITLALESVRHELRHNRAGDEGGERTRLPDDVFDLYAALCTRAGTPVDATRQRGTRSAAGAGAPSTRPFAGSDESRRLLSTIARVESGLAASQHETAVLRAQVRRLDDAVTSLRTSALAERGSVVAAVEMAAARFAVEANEDSSSRLRRLVARTVPARSRVLIAGKGEALLDGLPLDVSQFPATPSGEYLGYHPGDSLAAIAHVEALRAEGYQYLVVPASTAWWLDHYTGFRSHLHARCTQLAATPDGAVFALHRAAPDEARGALALADLVAHLRTGGIDDPTVLDWHSGLDIDRQALGGQVFSPPARRDTLPYLDNTIDVVVLPPTGDPLLREARRVASQAVVQSLGTPHEDAVAALWRSAGPEKGEISLVLLAGLGSVRGQTLSAAVGDLSQGCGEVVVITGDGPDNDAWLDPSMLPVPVRAVPCLSAAIAGACNDEVVVVDERLVPVGDWLSPLVEVLRRPGTGAVTGRVLSREGTLVHPAPESEQLRTHPDHPAVVFVRECDAAPPWLLALRRSALLDGAAGKLSPSCDALVHREDLLVDGWKLVYQPEAVMVATKDLARGGVVDARRRPRTSATELLPRGGTA